uniref:Citrate transporter-like domain-containing protein n=1 Tax=Noctiluca scintillans TaxID=2966 RepID=A0A7S1A4B3_NOCSC
MKLAAVLGISSAVVDNVPLVEAAINMFTEEPKDSSLWQLIALAAGTGGSCLSIGSVAGVTLMSMDGVGFLWYMQHVSPWALVGLMSGLSSYWLQQSIFG